MKKLTLIVALIVTANTTNANIIRGLWDSIRNQPDMTDKYDGIRKQYITSNLYVYKLKPKSKPAEVTSTQSNYDTEAIAEALKWQNGQHPDNTPITNKTSKPESKSIDSIASVNEKQTLYGKSSPLQDEAVLAAWERAREAEKRLELHRQYMERVRQSRKNVEQSKTAAAANQISE